MRGITAWSGEKARTRRLLDDPVERNRATAIRIIGYSSPPKPHVTAAQSDLVSHLVNDYAIEVILLERPLRPETMSKVLARFKTNPELQDKIVATIGNAKISAEPAVLLLRDLLKERSGQNLMPVIAAIGDLSVPAGDPTFGALKSISEENQDAVVRSAAGAALVKLKKNAASANSK